MGVQPRRTRVGVGVGVGVGKTGQGWGGGDEDRLGAVRSGAGDWFDRWGDAVRLCGPRRPRWWPGGGWGWLGIELTVVRALVLEQGKCKLPS